MKLKFIFPFLVPAIMAACKPDNQTSGGGDNTLPEPPETVVDAHVFIVDLFSTLGEDSFFIGRDPSVAAEYIKNQQQKLSLVYMFDRSDFTVGESNPMTDIAYATGLNPLFAQCNATDGTMTPGTGMLTRYPISDYDGISCEGAHLSGCRISVPVTGTPSIYISTAKIVSLHQAETIYRERKNRLASDCIIVGTVANGESRQVVDYFNSGSLRAVAYSVGDNDFDILVVTPANYVCRGYVEGKTVNLPYYRISIEKWM